MHRPHSRDCLRGNLGSVSTLAQALDALSQELPDVKQAARFQQNVLKRLVL